MARKLGWYSLVGWVGASMLLGACGCSSDKTSESPAAAVVSELRSPAARVVADVSEAAAAAQGEQAFAFSFLHALPGEKNVTFSPHSLSAAFAMLSDAAEGQTLAEIEQVLKFSPVNEAFHRSQDALKLGLAARNRAALDTQEEKVDAQTLSESNDVWIRDDAPPQASYLDTLAQFYGVGVHQADFGKRPEAARQAINAKISTDTHALIPELIGERRIDQDTLLVLTNALYFKAPWMNHFDDAVPGDFHALDGSTKSASMLQQQAAYLYCEGDGFVSVAVPYYGNDLELMLVVPDSGKYADVRAKLSGELLTELTTTRQSELVALTLPKFELKSEVPATDTFKALGLKTPFDPGAARFPKLPSQLGNAYISDVLHQATVAIDEKGTEASAATAIIGKAGSANSPGTPPQPKV
ncbi:MAG TPA: serpin family protein, partial [Polyangiaceae bacterium]|nr:serpin family protein [Polyangiaceae bacterium]